MVVDEAAGTPPVKVRVSGRWQVTHDGQQHLQGDEITVPAEVAEQWERARWVERVTKTKGA